MKWRLKEYSIKNKHGAALPLVMSSLAKKLNIDETAYNAIFGPFSKDIVNFNANEQLSVWIPEGNQDVEQLVDMLVTEYEKRYVLK